MKKIRFTATMHVLLCGVLPVLLLCNTARSQTAHDNTTNITNTKKKESTMYTTERNKEVIRQLYEQSLNKRELAMLNDIISEDYTGPGGEKGVPAFKKSVVALIDAFPDVQWILEELIGEGDKVMLKWRVEGTHKGQFQHVPPTGKRISSGGMGVFELKEGKVIRSQVLTDRLGFLQQLDALPADISQLNAQRSSVDHVRFIDKFFVPAAAQKEFFERMNINRSYIHKLPGFVNDAVYSYTDKDSNLVCITIAEWESREALDKAKEAVQVEYKRQGFDMQEMMKRLNIIVDRGVYTELKEGR